MKRADGQAGILSAVILNMEKGLIKMNNSKFILHEDMTIVKDSLQFESGTEIAYFEKGDYHAEILVLGDVSIIFSPSGFKEEDAQRYTSMSKFPQELREIIADGEFYDSDEIDHGDYNNNWFECFYGDKDYEESDVIDIEGMTPEEICTLCEELINNFVQEYGRIQQTLQKEIEYDYD